jgi:hypothetical protein
MSFMSWLLFLGPIAVVAGVLIGQLLTTTAEKRKIRQIEKLPSNEIRDLLLCEVELITMRSGLYELERRGASFDFIKPRLLDLAANPNGVVQMGARALLKDYFPVVATALSH